jgi:solute carrier family 24 (sodium/potassium/calcium exchanger), member 4
MFLISAIEQFPPPLLGPNIRKHGGLIIHVFVAIFTFLGLAIICDDYFVSSLDRICEGKTIIIRLSFFLL